MKKIFLFTTFFLIIFLFLNVKKTETESFISLNYEEKSLKNQSFFNLKLYDFNIYNLKELKNYNIEIISITPQKNIYNIEDANFKSNDIDKIIEESIIDYIKHINNDEEILYIKNYGFNIYKLKILATNEELIKLEKKFNFKILST